MKTASKTSIKGRTGIATLPLELNFAHSERDGRSHKITKSDYDRSINLLKRSIEEARLRWTEKRDALRRLGRRFKI